MAKEKQDKKPSLWKRIKQRIIQWLDDKEDAPKKPTKPGTQISRNPGLDCPQCHCRIQISIGMLISAEPIQCPACGLVLKVDKEQSKGCLTELNKLSDTMKKAEETAKGI